MAKYKKKTPRFNMKFINSDNNEILFEVNDRTWMNVGEILSDGAITSIINNEWKGKKPENLMILLVGEYELLD